MALLDNVSYSYYTDLLGRAIVPDEAIFNSFKFENVMYVKTLFSCGLIIEREENGLDKAVCMMIEEDYKASLITSGENLPLSSETIEGYSYQKNTKIYDKHIEQNSKSIEEKKYKWLKSFCYIT